MVCPNCGTLNSNEVDNCRKCTKALHPSFMKGKIACHVHANREAVTSCGVCGVRLCAACAVNHKGIDYCEACAPAEAVRPFFDADYEAIPVIDSTKTGRAQLQPRLFGFLIDAFCFLLGAVVFGIIAFLIANVTIVFRPQAGLPFYGFWIFVVLAWVGYNAIAVAMSGQTLGRKWNNVIVLKPDGKIVDARTAVIRAFAALLSLLPLGLGYLWAFFDPARETWHDKLAGTAVFDYEEVS